MITSISRELGTVQIPKHNGEIKMLPFQMENVKTLPLKFQAIVQKMITYLPFSKGEAYLTVDGRSVEQSSTHRRGGAHIDGNYIKETCGWGSGGGNGWKVGEGGRQLSSEHHKISYQKETGGMLIASDFEGCKGWNGKYEGEPGIGGDCSHIELGEGFKLKSNTVYYGNSQFIHESLPISESVHRTMVRVTLPLDYPLWEV